MFYVQRIKMPMRVAVTCGLLVFGALVFACDVQGPISSEESSDSLTVRLPELNGTVGDTVSVPVEVDTLDWKEVTSYQFTLPYDRAVMQVTGIRVEETMTPSRPVVNNQSEKGKVTVSFASSKPIEGAGTLLKIGVELTGRGSAPLAFQNFQLFDREAEEVAVALEEGRIVVE